MKFSPKFGFLLGMSLTIGLLLSCDESSTATSGESSSSSLSSSSAEAQCAVFPEDSLGGDLLGLWDLQMQQSSLDLEVSWNFTADSSILLVAGTPGGSGTYSASEEGKLDLQMTFSSALITMGASFGLALSNDGMSGDYAIIEDSLFMRVSDSTSDASACNVLLFLRTAE